MAQKLNSGSATLIAKSPVGAREHFYRHLKPWVHYIPVAEDFSDLDDRRAWLTAHDDEAQRIARNAADLFDAHFRSQDLFCYMALLFDRLQRATAPGGASATDLKWENARVGSKLGREPLPGAKDLLA